MLWHPTTHTNWFEYNVGSRLIHFRFPKQYRKEARDRVWPFFEKARPTTQRSQPTIDDPVMHATVMEKIKKVIKRRYLTTTSGAEDDIRMVYDATADKLNDAVWAPSF